MYKVHRFDITVKLDMTKRELNRMDPPSRCILSLNLPPNGTYFQDRRENSWSSGRSASGGGPNKILD